MLEKINFRNGVILSSAVLNEVQKATVHNPRFPRDNYYGLPSNSDEQIWYIGERDSIKDWELPDPQLEPASAMGRLAYDGIVLGCKNCDLDSEDLIELEYGPPRVTYRDLFSEPLPSADDDTAPIGLFINAGTYLDNSGEPVFWGVTSVLVDIGTNYVFYDKLNGVVVANSVLPNKTVPHVPLAKVEILPLILQDEFGDAITNPESARVVYQDLRPGLFIDSAKTVELLNVSEVILDDYQLQSWERIFVDSANGGVNITLPENPVDGDRVAIFDISGTFDLYPVRLYAENSQTILRENLTWDLSKRFSHTELVYYEPIKMWVFSGQDLGLGSKGSLGEFISCGGTECLGSFEAEDCPHNSIVPAVHSNPSEGVYSYEPQSSKCYKLLNETIAVYSDGDGGFIKIFDAPRCRKELVAPQPYGEDSRTIYVDIYNGNDNIGNNGLSLDNPLRTIERAMLEVVKTKHKYTVKLAPGVYYVDNTPGTAALFAASKLLGYHNLVDTELHVFSFDPKRQLLVVYGGTQDCQTPPPGLEVGRTIYTESGAYGTIASAERDRICQGECGWRFTLEGTRGSMTAHSKLYYNNLSNLNSRSGGLIVPKGTSIVSDDLRKTIIRPLFVPSYGQTKAYRDLDSYAQPSILKLTSDTYITGISFGDNLSLRRYHNTTSALSFAPQSEMLDRPEESDNRGYYHRVSVFLETPGISSFYINNYDSEIVSSAPDSREIRSEDIRENQTRALNSDKDGDSSSIRLPGDLGFEAPDVNSVYGSSPYVRNCTVRSIFGLCGIHANGALVSGFKSILADSFTVVSLQIDKDNFTSGTYLNDPAAAVNNKRFKDSDPDYPGQYRHYGYKASNEAYIQASSSFIIGCADHFVADNGGDISIVSSSSNFGDVSLSSRGFNQRAYSQDYLVPSQTSGGTRITELIPPAPISSFLQTKRVNTGLRLILDPSRLYYDNLEADGQPYRLYVESTDLLNPLSLENPPSYKSLNGFKFTKKDSENNHILAGETLVRDALYLTALDGKVYRSKFLLAEDVAQTDDYSKIFRYDPSPPETLTPLGSFTAISPNSTQITFAAAQPLLRSNSFLKINGAVYKVVAVGSNKTTAVLDRGLNFQNGETSGTAHLSSGGIDGGMWYVTVQNQGISNPISDSFISDVLGGQSPKLSNNSPLFILRDLDTRAAKERIYRVKLEGYLPDLGVRPPQEGYILSKQYDLDPESSLIDPEDPLVLTNISPGDNPGTYSASLVQASEYRLSKTPAFYPTKDLDCPESSAQDSPTYRGVHADNNGFKHFGVAFKLGSTVVETPEPSEQVYKVSDQSGGALRIETRRPSMIRSASHMWEWVGYLSYDSALPKYQGPRFDHETYLSKLFDEHSGGRIFSSGLDQDGVFYLDNQPSNPSEEAVLLETPGDDSDLPLSTLAIENSLTMNPGSDFIFLEDTIIKVVGETRVVRGDNSRLTADDSDTGVIANIDFAGLTQLATTSETIAGEVENKAVTPYSLASLTSTNSRKGLVQLANTVSLSNNTLALTGSSLVDFLATTDSPGLTRLSFAASRTDNSRALTGSSLFAENNNLTATVNRLGFVQLATGLDQDDKVVTSALLTSAALDLSSTVSSLVDRIDLLDNTQIALYTDGDLVLYVSNTAGSDLYNTGLTAESPVRTIQKAIFIASTYRVALPHRLVIQLADGVYPERVVVPSGLAYVVEIIGNNLDPSLVVLSGTQPNSDWESLENIGTNKYTLLCSGALCRLEGITIGGSVPNKINGVGIQFGGTLFLNNCALSSAYNGVLVQVDGYAVIENNCTISGNFDSVFLNANKLDIRGFSDEINSMVLHNLTHNTFITSVRNSSVNWVYSTIANSGAAPTGSLFRVIEGSILVWRDVASMGSVTHLVYGSEPGTTDTGGAVYDLSSTPLPSQLPPP